MKPSMMAEKKKKRSTSRKKNRAPFFFPDSASCVGSPTNGVQLKRRTVRQLTPQKLCSLALPPPLLSLFDADGSIAARGGEEQSVGNRGRQTSNASISAGSTGTHHNAILPPHIRVGFAKCDPLLVFDGRYVLVGTADGRIAIYSILEFDYCEVSQDIKMSERRRQREWEEEDSESQTDTKEEKKVDDDNINVSGELAEEENESEIRESMIKRERARLIDPLLIVTLPNRHKHTSLVCTDEDNGSASVFSPPTIIAMCATPKTGTSLVEQRNANNFSISNFGGGFLGHVAVLTDDGEVHVLEFTSSDTSNQIPESNDEAGSNAGNAPVVVIILSFDTKNSGATSICMRPADGPALRLCVGSESGLLTEFQLHSASYHHSRTSTSENLPIDLTRQHGHEIKVPTNSLQRQLSEPSSSPSKTRQHGAGPTGTVKVTLCWQGLSDAPIRSLSCTGWGGDKTNAKDSFLVVGTEQRQYSNTLSNFSPSPAISVDVINASLAESIWRRSNAGDPRSNIIDDKVIPLSDCSVWPAAGMELKDGWLRGTTKWKPDVKQQLFNTADLQRVSTTNKLCCFEDSQQCFASAASDGTVAISHCMEDGSWGITNDSNQIMLSQKSIGLGTIKSENERYIACCLRGGTIYLVPVVEGIDPRKDIMMYATPVDSADCGAVRYVHNFIAGLAQVKPWQGKREEDNSSSMKCAAMIGWSGGKIDVYEMNTAETNDNCLLNKLTERGTTSKMVEMIMNMDESHHQLKSSLWKQAWDECMKANEVETVASRVRNLNDETFKGTRSLILSLVNGA